MHFRPELKLNGLVRVLLDGPPGERFGHRDDIVLRVIVVDAQRMQFHQFTAVVFVQAFHSGDVDRIHHGGVVA